MKTKGIFYPIFNKPIPIFIRTKIHVFKMYIIFISTNFGLTWIKLEAEQIIDLCILKYTTHFVKNTILLNQKVIRLLAKTTKKQSLFMIENNTILPRPRDANVDRILHDWTNKNRYPHLTTTRVGTEQITKSINKN